MKEKPVTFRCNTLLASIAPLALITAATVAAPVDLSVGPTIDRWNYPFGDFDGARAEIPIFTANNAGFDDRDAEGIFVFDAATGNNIDWTTATITSVTLRAQVTASTLSLRFTYDPTHDFYTTYLATTNPLYQADTDTGRPVELFAAGFRPNITLASGLPLGPMTYQENTEFASIAANPPPARNCRNVWPVAFDAAGAAIPCPNNITGSVAEGGVFEATPLSVGQIPGLAAGAPVNSGTFVNFTLDLTQPGALAYVRQGLSSGRLFLIISSLHPSRQPGTGSQLPYPIFVSKETIFGTAASLRILADTGSPGACLADVASDSLDTTRNPNASVGSEDLDAFIAGFIAADAGIADVASDSLDTTFNPNGSVGAEDLDAFIAAFVAGC